MNATSRMNQVLLTIQQGTVTPTKISEELSLSSRHVYRIIDKLVDEGKIYSPFRGVYYPLGTSPISLQAHINSCTFKMSQDHQQQHNNTQQDVFNTNLVSEVERVLKQRQIQVAGTDSDTVTTNVALLTKIVEYILDMSNIPFTAYELQNASNVLKDSPWWLINEANISSIVCGALSILEAQESMTTIFDRIRYLFGIIKRLLCQELRRVSVGYKQMLINNPEFAVGVQDSQLGTLDNKNRGSDIVASDYENRMMLDSSSGADPKREIPVAWLTVAALIRHLADDCSVREIPDAEILLVVNQLDQQGVHPERAEMAIRYMAQHNDQGKVYFVQQMRNGQVVYDAIQKNYIWYSKYGMDGPGSHPEKSRSLAKQEVPDERYRAFYKLFPDT